MFLKKHRFFSFNPYISHTGTHTKKYAQLFSIYMYYFLQFFI